jgi:putative oxidoreductase
LRQLIAIGELIGRIFFSLIFILSGKLHFSGMGIGYAQSKGVPIAEFLVPFSGALAVLGGLSIAFGFKTKWGALFIIAFLIPVTLMMHNFWTLTGKDYQMQHTMFMKNTAMLGGALILLYHGAGKFSVDAFRKNKLNPINNNKEIK